MEIVKKLCVLSLIILPWMPVPAASEENEQPDVRVLIDVSGSMKKNDPGNLRIPAMKLLINLVPSGSHVGAWVFAQDTESMIPLSRVNSRWKEKAIASTSDIHSKGLFTNIETALKQATKDWKGTKPFRRRSLILLTDGVVDVSKNKADSEQSRERILGNLLPQLQQTGVQIHTIALSDKADHALLKKLSFDTGGWNETVLSADQLQRTFLKMFKKAVPRDTVPLKGNKFSVDASINEFSVLIFRKPGALPTKLIQPDDSELSEDHKSADTHWHHEQGYDLITISNPLAGEWRLDAELDPDNQVMIVTDLKLKVTELPNYVTESEALTIAVSMTEKGNEIIRDDFLDLLAVSLIQEDNLGRKKEWHLARDTAVNSRFIQPLSETLSVGKHTFTVVMDGKTFQREMTQTIQVVDNPITVNVQISPETVSPTLSIALAPDLDIVDLSTLEIKARKSGSDSKQIDVPENNGTWILNLDIPQPGQRIVVNFSVTAKSIQGNDITPKVRPVVIDENLIAKLLPKTDETESEDDALEEKEDEEDTEETVAEPDWLMTGLIAGGVNIALLVGGFFGYKAIKKRSLKDETELLERLST
ncbi:MAG: vWA domain-containing protein [Methylococcales bacterium]